MQFCATCFRSHLISMSLSEQDKALLTANSFITFLLTGRIQWPEELDLDLSAELMNTNQYSK